MPDLLERVAKSLEDDPVVHYFEAAFQGYPDLLMKDMTLEAVGPDRQAKLNGRWVVNFGSDSFLGLDQDPRIRDAVRRGLDRWGTHNGSSRAFASVAANVEAERKLATWLQCESTLIYPSVTLANQGALPALVTRHDALVVDRNAHHSVHEGMKLVRAGGGKTNTFAHDDLPDLERVLKRLRPYRHAVVAVDGIYSMTGTFPPLAGLRAVAEANDAILYVDDAHGTGILGKQGRGTVLDALGDYRNTLAVGSLSKAFSCFGAFVTCSQRMKLLLKIRSGPLIFGGPVPPPYLEAGCAVVDILDSPEYHALRSRLAENMEQFLAGVRGLGLTVLGGVGAIASIVVGDEFATLRAGRELFERGYYVQSVVYPGVPHHGGVLRIQINANHRPESITGLVEAIAGLAASGPLSGAGPGRPSRPGPSAG
jgi:7-keto-8-aminopelargonate synthetase-like enzyme